MRYKIVFVVILIFFFKNVTISAQNETVSFSGFTWNEKLSHDKVGPGDNVYGLKKNNIHLNCKKQIVLKILKVKGEWSCAELFTDTVLGYGTYEFYLNTNLKRLDKNTVLGLFLYNYKEPPYFNEVDIEFSRWGGELKSNSQYAIHHDLLPWFYRFNTNKLNKYTIHDIQYKPGEIVFKSYYCDDKKFSDPVLYSTKKYDTSIDSQNHLVNIRMNFWLYENKKPRRCRQKAVISRVTFTP